MHGIQRRVKAIYYRNEDTIEMIEFPKELEPILANAVSLGRAYLIDKKRYDDARRLDEAINQYRQQKINKQ